METGSNGNSQDFIGTNPGNCYIDYEISPPFYGVLVATLTRSSTCKKKKATQTMTRDFSNAVNDCLLSDLGYIGEQMTWINGQEGEDLILEKLDRVLHTTKWLGLFLFTQVFICDL